MLIRHLVALVIIGYVSPTASSMSLNASAKTLDHKLIFGFQGWFACPDDGNPTGSWNHWFSGKTASPSSVTVDLLPDITELTNEERCETGFVDKFGNHIVVFSDQRYATVLRQFQWMYRYQLDGIALQRFVVSLRDAPHLIMSNRVLANVKKAAEATRRSFFIQYDTSGADSNNWVNEVEEDWRNLLHTGTITRSAAYSHHRKRLVFGITGPGMQANQSATPEQTLRLIRELREITRPWGGISIVATVPRGWRTLTDDAQSDPGWSKVYRAYDVLSPWLVGSYHKPEEISRYVEEQMKPDLEETRQLGIDLMPVIFPGLSWAHVQRNTQLFDTYPRRCGHFLWEQVQAFHDAGATMIYGAMFDEVDEGTAFFKTIAHKDSLPTTTRFLSLDHDGCDLPSDWYLRIGGEATKLVHGKTGHFLTAH